MNIRSLRLMVIIALLGSVVAACGANPPATTGGATTTPAPVAAACGAAGGMIDSPGSAAAPAPLAAQTVAAGSRPQLRPATQGEPIPIGIALAQTGNIALIGQEQVIGARIAEKFFNDRGGVNGQPIKLIFQDAGSDEAGANNAFQSLINNDKVVGIVGPTLSQQAFSADPIAERAKVPVIGPSNTANGIPEIGDYIARVSAPIAAVAPNAVEVALKMNPGIKKVAVFYAQNDAYSKSETAAFQKAVTDTFKLELVTVQTFQTTDTDFTTQATAAINVNPDLVIISSLSTDGGNLVKQLRELGYKCPIVGGNGLNTTNVFPVCQQYCDGIIIAQAYSYQLETEVNTAFRKAYMDEQKKEPPQFSAQSFTAVQVFVEALTALDKKTKLSTLSLEQLREQLNQQILAGKYNTPLGEISFTPNGDINQSAYYVAQIKMEADNRSGTFVFVK